MTYSFNSKYRLLLLAMALAAGSTMADSGPTSGLQVNKDKILADMIAEVERDGQQFTNSGEEDRLRHRVNEQDKENAQKVRREEQRKTMNKHQYQSETERRSQPKSGGGSMSRGGGGGGGKGGGRR